MLEAKHPTSQKLSTPLVYKSIVCSHKFLHTTVKRAVTCLHYIFTQNFIQHLIILDIHVFPLSTQTAGMMLCICVGGWNCQILLSPPFLTMLIPEESRNQTNPCFHNICEWQISQKQWTQSLLLHVTYMCLCLVNYLKLVIHSVR